MTEAELKKAYDFLERFNSWRIGDTPFSFVALREAHETAMKAIAYVDGMQRVKFHTNLRIGTRWEDKRNKRNYAEIIMVGNDWVAYRINHSNNEWTATFDGFKYSYPREWKPDAFEEAFRD